MAAQVIEAVQRLYHLRFRRWYAVDRRALVPRRKLAGCSDLGRREPPHRGSVALSLGTFEAHSSGEVVAPLTFGVAREDRVRGVSVSG
ncbi:hypothetical protein Cci01nite_41260 [Catellatospora citrea]|uniref:Uncharacterized protein n=1 Tax=Catellatospora citrea TaxID=53366 RepID=A0A8J3K9R3_9ACTN|nr:hypothetical protein Cci01nite_41260 [Catellatospora citrea]